ncbi:50S ribosomal protein L11 [endosymbiont of Euscepes postfasciatus]|uniref:50S ribosomal protein L11 n=1 Tax=endosymbiont of Euscepes postfasciatus TaxID=650377 RepID=UPI000DC70DD2|nr:50S ribosomal protein L11 [endosymbiont of Euscepes postfasciatus]BBA84703.1 50S ribosomal protein L11 [endosymbiont of Euscepes postfasciatus]
MKKIISYLKLQIYAKKATPNPPIGSILGQKGINIISFCNKFNDRTKDFSDILVSVFITIYDDKSFDFIIKTTPTSILLKKELNINKGSSNCKNKIIGSISKSKIEEISKIKFNDMLNDDINIISKSIIGTAKSMGIEII